VIRSDTVRYGSVLTVTEQDETVPRGWKAIRFTPLLGLGSGYAQEVHQTLGRFPGWRGRAFGLYPRPGLVLLVCVIRGYLQVLLAAYLIEDNHATVAEGLYRLYEDLVALRGLGAQVGFERARIILQSPEVIAGDEQPHEDAFGAGVGVKELGQVI